MLGEPTFLRHTPRKNENNFKYFLVVFKLSIVLGVDIVLRLLNHLPLLIIVRKVSLGDRTIYNSKELPVNKLPIPCEEIEEESCAT